MSSPVEQIKQRLTIVDVIGSYIKLQKAGANFKAVCPFHSEKTPSFYVSPPREIWHCFGCGKGGDMFEFVKEIEGVEFVEALRILAGRAGVALKAEDPRFRNERVRLLDLMEEAAKFYEKNLSGCEEVLSYLKKRGLNEKTIQHFRLGFALPEETGWRHLFSYLKTKGFTADEIEKSGMIVQSEKAKDDGYDRFRGRIMFPLADASGRILGFSGRVFALPPEALAKEGAVSAKYINTPQTILYDKSKLLYAFDKAKIEIRKQDLCILMEGQMDVLMAHQAEVPNVVAVSGTALTAFHLENIGRLTRNLVMCFDADEAGISAAKRSIDLSLEKDFEIKVISLLKGKDPADMILEDSEAFKKCVNGAKHIFEFFLDNFYVSYGNTREFKKEVERNVLPYLLSLQSGIERSHWIKEIAKRLDVKEEVILEEVKKIYESSKQGPSHRACEDPPFFDKGKFLKRSQLLKERLAGVALWKNDKKLIPEMVRTEIAEILNAEEKDREKLAFEAELCYIGMDNLTEEIEHLAKELKKELLKEKLTVLAKEIRQCEEKCEKEILENKIAEFQKLSKELMEVS